MFVKLLLHLGLRYSENNQNQQETIIHISTKYLKLKVYLKKQD